jgi:hypothetical protein
MTKHKFTLSDVIKLKDAVALISSVQQQIIDDQDDYKMIDMLMYPIEETIDAIEAAKGE